MSGAGLAFDLTPLRRRVPDDQARAEAVRRFRDEGQGETEGRVAGMAVLRAVVLVLGAWALAVLLVDVIQALGGAQSVSVSTVVIGGLMVLPLAVAQVRGIGGGLRGMRRNWYLLSRFAEANGLTHRIRGDATSYGAQLFRIGDDRVVTDVVTGSRPRRFEAGNYAFETWVARGRMPHEAAYVVFDTVNPLPSAALITTATEGGPASWTPKQGQHPLPIEGPLSGRFRVHCAPEDADAVRRLLTPDVSARLVEVAGEVDVEIITGRIFFLARRSAPVGDPAFWEWVEDLSRMLDNGLDPRPGVPTGLSHAEDAARALRRRGLFRLPGAGRMLLIGCLIPLVVGIGLGVLTAVLT